MSIKTTHIAAAAFLVGAVEVPMALAHPGQAEQGKPLAMLRSGTSISVDDHYISVMGSGQIMRIDKASGAEAGQLTPSGWSGAGAAAGGGGTATGGGQSTTGAGGGR